jgi:hypothetical protein
VLAAHSAQRSIGSLAASLAGDVRFAAAIIEHLKAAPFNLFCAPLISFSYPHARARRYRRQWRSLFRADFGNAIRSHFMPPDCTAPRL